MNNIIQALHTLNCYENSTAFPINQLPDEILEQIFYKIAGKYLIKNVVLVCKRWKNIIENEYFWLQKGFNDEKINECILLQNNSIFTSKELYFYKQFKQNLIKNPYGDDGYNHWLLNSRLFSSNNIRNRDIIKTQTQNVWNYYISESNDKLCQSVTNWCIQKANPNDKSEFYYNGTPFMIKEKIVSQFATSYYEGSKLQIIDFQAEGITTRILETEKPRILISENYSSTDCSGIRYSLTVKLLNHNFEQIDQFEFDRRIKTGGGCKWYEVSHVFENVSSDLRYIIYFHAGCDTRYWAGFYGTKITNSCVRLLF